MPALVALLCGAGFMSCTAFFFLAVPTFFARLYTPDAGVVALAATLIPLAHPISLAFADVTASVNADAGLVELVAEARTTAPTGVEMEAMTACAVAALTVYDMVKGIERGVELEQVVLLEKAGGRADWRRTEAGQGP